MVMPSGDLDDAALLSTGASAGEQAQPDGEPGQQAKPAAAPAIPALTLDDVEATLARHLTGMRAEMSANYRGAQSATGKLVAKIERENADLRELVHEMARATIPEETLAALTKKQQDAATKERETELMAQVTALSQVNAQQAAAQQQGGDPVWNTVILPELEAYAAEQGVNLEAVSKAGALPGRVVPTAKDPTGWLGYKKAAIAAIDAAANRADKAAEPKPKAPSARPAAAPAVPASGGSSRGYFEAHLQEQARTGAR